MQADQSTTGASTYVEANSNFRASDLQVAAVTTTGSATRAFTMAHKMGLAKINMKTWNSVKNVVFYIASPSSAADTNYTWDNQATTDVTSSSTYTSSAKPYQSTSHWYILSANTTFTTSATQTGVANYAGVGASAATVNADVRNNNAWTREIGCTRGKCTEYTPTITATSYLSRVPYTLEYGDALYSDGALSKTTNSSYFWSGRTAIAYVTSIKNASNGAPHGYAFSFRRHPTLYLWQNAYADSPLPNVATTNYASDYNGYTNTRTLSTVTNAATVYPAAYAAWTYIARNKANSSANVSLTGNLASSHWFLPSSGQVNDVVKNIAGITSSPSIAATNVYWTITGVSTTFLNKVNAVLNNIRNNGGYTLNTIPMKYGSPDYSGKGGESTWWTSTEISSDYCYLLIVWQTNQLYFCETSDHGDSDTKRGDSHSVWPCIAF